MLKYQLLLKHHRAQGPSSTILFRFPDFCMSGIQEERVELRGATMCAAETGHVYIVGR